MKNDNVQNLHTMKESSADFVTGLFSSVQYFLISYISGQRKKSSQYPGR